MDKAPLVRSDLEIEGRILEALSSAKIPVTLVDWDYAPEDDEWQLVVATPWVERKGPREAYSQVIKALQEASIYEEVPMRRVFVLSPDDHRVKALEEEIKIRREGAIHIMSHDGNKPNHEKVYSIIFTPFAGTGGAVPAKRITGLRELSRFLEERLHIAKASIDEALAELARKESTSVPNVRLTNREAKRLGLA